MYKKIAAVVGLAFSVLALVPNVVRVSAASTFSAAVQGGNSIVVGQSNNYTVTVTDNGGAALNAIVDVEIHDSSNNKVFQQYYSGQNFGTGQAQSYGLSWTPGATGSYTLDVGVFSANWSNLLAWDEAVLPITVHAAVPVPSSGSFTATGGASPSNPSVGQPVNFSANVRNNSGAAGNLIVDFEVHDSSNNKIFQQFYAGQNFAQGQNLSYGFTWTPAAAGTYSLDVGVFSANWASVLYWQNGVAAVDAGAASVSAPAPTTTTTAAAPATLTTSVQSTPSTSGTLSGGFYVDPNSDAANQAVLWSASDPIDAARMALIAAEPQATWFGGWNANVTSDVNTLVGAAQSAGKMPVLVAYNIPDRDCGGFSAGGAQTPSAYRSWIQAFAQGIGSRPAMVILEPDALASLDCLTPSDQRTRMNLLSYAVQTLKALAQTKVYLDAGNSNWIGASTMASRLGQADVAAADGFSLNVSNFYTTDANVQYGQAVSSEVGGKHFVIDTSRNGNGSDGEWCNPPGRALGIFPTTNTGNALADAFLWIKRPGESDGSCNGGPAAGTWWPQYAAGLAADAGY